MSEENRESFAREKWCSVILITWCKVIMTDERLIVQIMLNKLGLIMFLVFLEMRCSECQLSTRYIALTTLNTL